MFSMRKCLNYLNANSLKYEFGQFRCEYEQSAIRKVMQPCYD